MSKTNLLNALLFNAAWLACVLGGSKVAVPATALLLAAHVRYVCVDWRELVLAVQALALGFFVDAMFLQSGVLLAPESSQVPPAWLLCLWVAFATTLNHSMAWLQPRPLLAALTGLAIVPLSYLAGTRLTAFELADPQWQALAWIGLAWALVLPLLAWLAQQNSARFVREKERIANG